MAEGYQALTAKEKEALRLLLGGHDAKSMANQLGLSVHTINERLRDARRKLSVSSSKAAARILRDAEAPAPQLLGDRISGDAGQAARAHNFDPGPAHLPRRATWTIGGFAMIALLVAALALSSTEPAAPPAAATAATTPTAATARVAESEVSRAARDWLTLVDARKWQESWAATADSFRALNTLANWQAAAEQVHARLGPAQSRELLSDEDTPAPPNGYRTLRFRTSFANNHGATEVIALAQQGNQWRVAGIYVE